MNENLFNPAFPSEAFLLEGSSTGILLFHGFTATTLEVRGLAEEIHSQLGWTVYAPLLPGHGTSPHDLAKTRYTEWIECAENAFIVLENRTNRWFVGGESMGGLLALYLAARHPEIEKLVVYAPALKIAGIIKAKLFSRFVLGSPKRHLAPTKEGFLPWQGYRINPLKAVIELGLLQNKIQGILPEIHQPILIYQGKQDETIDHQSAFMVYNAVSSREKHLVELDDCGHCVLLDRQHREVNTKSIEFLVHKQKTQEN